MPDLAPVGTVELLTRAADAAGRMASHCQHEWPKRSTWRVILDRWPGLRSSDSPLAASGPGHWRTVEAMLRQQLALHQPEMHTEYGIPIFDEFDSSTATYRRCEGCHRRYMPLDGYRESDGCPTLRALRPLAEQVLQHLGETE